MARFATGSLPCFLQIVSRQRQVPRQLDDPRNRSRKIFVTLVCLGLLALPATAESSIPAAEAKNQIGENATVATAEDSPVPARIIQPIDETKLTVLKGNTHRLAQQQFDQGVAPPDLPMRRMLLVLRRSPEQQAGLGKLLSGQIDKSSPNYHKWLTPDQFGKQFGPADQDMQVVTSWLQSHGFEIGSVAKGRTMIEFSGTAAQVQEALHTSIHKYLVHGEEHWANATDPQIPTALTPVVVGVHTLHNFLKKPLIHFTGQRVGAKYVPGKLPQVTLTDGTHALGPPDYATIYNAKPLYDASTPLNGSGTTIAVVARSDLGNGNDIPDFRSLFNLSGGSFNEVYNGPDPGDLGGGEEVEATLDSSWAGAIAPAANVNFVISATTNTTDGADLSELYIIDNNSGDVMSESFGTCEAAVTSTEAQGTSLLAEQAAAQGITYVVAAGDNGAEGCDDPDTETVATGPISVNVLAATPYNVAVGGTMFNENGQDSKYWSTTNNQSNGESAISYIPENVWNQSCPTAQCGNNANIWAGSGGASTFFIKPSWQANVRGIPNDGQRHVPDVSLTAASHDPYLICLEDSCAPNSQGEIAFYLVSGTSASTPAFAGIMSLVDQKMGQVTGKTVDRQGQADYVLYPLAASENPQLTNCNASNTSNLPSSSCIFNDVTVGNNEVPGETGYPNAPYDSGVGYDQATGLGSVNVANLVGAWSSATFNATTTTLSLSPTTITHGQSVSVDIGVASTGGKGTPSGEVSLLRNGNQPFGIPLQNFILSGGALLTSTYDLPGGTYSVTAHYAGDATFAPSDSSPVNVTVTPETSQTNLSVCTYPIQQNSCPAYTGGPYGSFVYLRADISSSTQKCPPDCGVATGSIQFYDNNGSVGNPTLNSQGNASAALFDLNVGSHSIWALYSGDTSYNESQSAPPYNFTITPAPTTTAVTWTGDFQGADLTATITSNSGSPYSMFGTVTFFVNRTPTGGPQQVAPVPAYPVIDPISYEVIAGAQGATNYFNDTQLANGKTYTVTASYSGDVEYEPSNSPTVKITLQPDFELIENQNLVTISTPGGSGTLALTLGVLDGFNGTVNFSSSPCSGLPAGASCSITPSSLTGRGAPATVTVTTTAPATSMLRRDIRQRGTTWASTSSGLMMMIGLVLLGVPSKRQRLSMILPLLLCASLVMVSGCGGGGSSSSQSNPIAPPAPTPTPVGSYTVAVTATSGTLSHKITFTLNVQ
jgi:hypothetical protein